MTKTKSGTQTLRHGIPNTLKHLVKKYPTLFTEMAGVCWGGGLEAREYSGNTQEQYSGGVRFGQLSGNLLF
jgi:hypothetical protein